MQVSAWLFLLHQTLSSACLMMAIGLCAGRQRAAPWRLLLTSLFLALATMAAMGRTGLAFIMLPLAALAPLAAFPGAPRRFRLRMAVCGGVFPLLLTGLMRLFAPLPVLLSLPLGGALLLLVARADSHAPPVPSCATVEVTIGRTTAVLTALVDTGNLLRDSVTGLPVIVIGRHAAARLTHLPGDGTLLPGMRLLPVRTVSGVTLMTVMHPDRLRMRTGGGAWQISDALIGLSPGGGEGFQALVPASLLTTPSPPAARQAAAP